MSLAALNPFFSAGRRPPAGWLRFVPAHSHADPAQVAVSPRGLLARQGDRSSQLSHMALSASASAPALVPPATFAHAAWGGAARGGPGALWPAHGPAPRASGAAPARKFAVTSAARDAFGFFSHRR